MTLKAPHDVMVRFHEIALKGKNRPTFIRQLVDNVRRATAGIGVKDVWAGRMLVRVSLEETADWDVVRERVSRVFGAVKFAPSYRAALDYDAIAEVVSAIAADRSFESFRISAHRADKAFHMTSYELNVKLGDMVNIQTGARVDLKHPELDIRVDLSCPAKPSYGPTSTPPLAVSPLAPVDA
jgi:thiamine biosynthesis protein ThiI